MTELSAAISQIVILFLIVILGFILSKVGYLDQDMSNKLSGILLNVTLPCMIIASVSEMDFASAQNQIPITVLLAILSFVVMIVVSLGSCFSYARAQARFIRIYVYGPMYQLRIYGYSCYCLYLWQPKHYPDQYFCHVPRYFHV